MRVILQRLQLHSLLKQAMTVLPIILQLIPQLYVLLIYFSTCGSVSNKRLNADRYNRALESAVTIHITTTTRSRN